MNQASLHFLDNTPTPLTATSPSSQSKSAGISNSPFNRTFKNSLTVILGSSPQKKSSKALQSVQTIPDIPLDKLEDTADFETMSPVRLNLKEQTTAQNHIQQEPKKLTSYPLLSPKSKSNRRLKAASLIDTNFEQNFQFFSPKSNKNMKKDPSWKNIPLDPSPTRLGETKLSPTVFSRNLYKSKTILAVDDNTNHDLKTSTIKDPVFNQSPQVKKTRKTLRQISLSSNVNYQLESLSGLESLRQSELQLSPQSKSKLAFLLKKPLELPGTGSMPYLERLVKRSQKPEILSSGTEYTLLDRQQLTSTVRKRVVKPKMSPEELSCFANNLQHTSQLSPTKTQKKISIYQSSASKKFNHQDQQKLSVLKGFAKETIIYGKY